MARLRFKVDDRVRVKGKCAADEYHDEVGVIDAVDDIGWPYLVKTPGLLHHWFPASSVHPLKPAPSPIAKLRRLVRKAYVEGYMQSRRLGRTDPDHFWNDSEVKAEMKKGGGK